MARIRYNIDGKLEIDWAPGEFRQRVERWQNLPETKAMFAKIAEERKARVAAIIAEIDAKKKR